MSTRANDDATGPALYAGGTFTTAGGGSANRIAKWDGSAWSPLGSGMNGGASLSVSALTVFDDGMAPALFAGGKFTGAGGKPSAGIAAWRPDCDNNGISNLCELTCAAPGGFCSTVSCCGQSNDCNANGSPDACDIAKGTADCNANAIPDICEGRMASTPVPDTILNASGVSVPSVKSRYLSYSGGVSGLPLAVRLKFVSLPGAFNVFNGTTAWVASPFPGGGFPPVGPSFLVAPLSTSPVYADWAALGTVHVFDERIHSKPVTLQPSAMRRRMMSWIRAGRAKILFARSSGQRGSLSTRRSVVAPTAVCAVYHCTRLQSYQCSMGRQALRGCIKGS